MYKRQTIVTIIILKIIECWNSYVWPRLVTDNPDLFLVSNGIQEIRENGFGRENIPAMMAAVVVISVPDVYKRQPFRICGHQKAANGAVSLCPEGQKILFSLHHDPQHGSGR